MFTLQHLSWIAAGRRLIAGATLGLAVTGTAFGAGFDSQHPLHQPPVKNYRQLFESNDVEYGHSISTGGTRDFGPDPTSYGNTGRHETRKPVFDGNDLWQTPNDFDYGHQPVQQYQPEKPAEPTESEKIEMRLSSRYGNPVVERFVKGTNANRFAELYLETSRLIDSRHIEPTSYQARVNQAAENLRHAIGNDQFRRVFGLNASAAQNQAFLRELDSYVSSQQVRTANDALRVMSGVASMASRTLGLSANAIAAEFVYGATESLDKYSSFNPEAPAMRPSASTGLEDSVVGIGVEIKPHDQGVIVVKALRGSPAERAECSVEIS